MLKWIRPSVVEGHNIAGEVKAKLMGKIESLRGVMVHVEPYFTSRI